MPTRRHFIRSAGIGIVFCSCGLKRAYAQATTGSLASARTGGRDDGDHSALNYKHPDFGKKHAPIVIDGRRVKTVDAHAHVSFMRRSRWQVLAFR